jgi:hypothetical protein
MIPAKAVEAARGTLPVEMRVYIGRVEMRAALAAAAPHMLAIIGTRVELEDLWLGAVVLSESVAYQRFGTDEWAGEGRSFDGGQIALPAIVLHNPNPYRPTK